MAKFRLRGGNSPSGVACSATGLCRAGLAIEKTSDFLVLTSWPMSPSHSTVAATMASGNSKLRATTSMSYAYPSAKIAISAPRAACGSSSPAFVRLVLLLAASSSATPNKLRGYMGESAFNSWYGECRLMRRKHQCIAQHVDGGERVFLLLELHEDKPTKMPCGINERFPQCSRGPSLAPIRGDGG